MDCKKPRVDQNLPSTLKQGADKRSGFACGKPGHIAPACPEKVAKEVHICNHQTARSTLATYSGEIVQFLLDSGYSGSACSLIKSDLFAKFSDTARNKRFFWG